jgi:hypothetical protein
LTSLFLDAIKRGKRIPSLKGALMFDPREERLTRVWLCALSDIPVETYKYLLKSETWPFLSDYDAGKGWARYSAIHVCIASAMRKLADKNGFGLSWPLAARIAHAGAAGFYCVLKDRYGELSNDEAADVLSVPWDNRTKDLWTGYARIAPANGMGDEGGWTLPCGTFGSLSAVLETPPDGESVCDVHTINLSQIVREVEARGRGLKINFPFDQNLAD